ncbi:metallophosphoesterase [Methylobacterium sp. D54C]
MPVHKDGGQAAPVAATPLFRLWRTVGPDSLSSELAAPLSAAARLVRDEVGPTGEDGPATVGEARDALERHGLPHGAVDVAVTAVLARALLGDGTAAGFLSEALDLMAAAEGGGPHHARFARAWRDRRGYVSAGAEAPVSVPSPITVAHSEGRPMRLWIFSDLHLDVGGPWMPVPIPSADLAIVAGDVAEGLVQSLSWLADVVLPHMPVAFVAGNHEFYRRCLPEEMEAGRAAAARTGIHLLENDTVRIGDVAVSGCTLWTDYELDGPAMRDAAIGEARMGLNDHRVIRWTRETRPRLFQPEEARALHVASRKFLEEALGQVADASTRAHVVVTHHAPSAGSVAPRFAGSPLNAAFASRLDNLIWAARPALWVHGHTHTPFDYQLGKTRVLCNPRGYLGENPGFRPGLVVEV